MSAAPASPALKRTNTKGEEFPGTARQPSNFLTKIDHKVTYRVFRLYEDFVGLRWPLMLLEFSGHGVPYIIAPVAAILCWDAPDDNVYVLLANFWVGIITDLLWSVVLKPTVRRVRPYWAGQKQLGTVETVDQFSFPSGHTTRAVFVACFASYVHKSTGLISENVVTGVAVWSGILAISRVFLGRHFVGDITVGALVGYLNFRLVRDFLWIDQPHVMDARAKALGFIAMATVAVNAKLAQWRGEDAKGEL